MLLLSPFPLHAQEPPPPPPAPIVTAVEVRSDAPLSPSLDLDTLIETDVGEPLDPEAVRHTLRNLQASGTAARTELYTRDDPGGGVVVVIVFRTVVQVEEVRIVGHLGLPRDTLQRALLQTQGEPLAEDKVVRGVYALEDLYRNSGYFSGRARVSVQTDEARRQAVVTYTVDSGARALVTTVAFDKPVAPFEPAALVKQLRVKPGEYYSQRLAHEDAERLQDWLVRQRYGMARVDPPAEEHDAAANTVKLTYPITIGPKISLKIQGADEDTLRRKGLLPFLGEAGYDEALVLQAQSRIKAYFQRQGNYDVQVAYEEQRVGDELVLTFRIDTGPEYTLREVVLAGNQEIEDKKLRPLLRTTERRLLRPGSGRLVQADLDQDVEDLQGYYALQGYAQAKVGPPQVEKQEKPGQELRLVIPIAEGPRQRVASLRFEGIENLDVERVKANIPLKEAGGFHPVLLDNSLDEIRAEYAVKGFRQAQVSARQAWDEAHTLVDVSVEVLEGPQQVVDRIIVRGNQRTESEVIRRTLDLDRGEPISEVKLLETERALYQLGIFSRVDVGLVSAGLDETERDVLVRLSEGKPRALTYGIGWDSEDKLRGLLGFTNNNVAGRAYSLRTGLRWSQRNKRFHFIFNQPYLFEQPISLTSTAFYEDDARTNRHFEVTRYGARTEAVRLFGRRRVSLGVDYHIVELSNVDPGIASNEIERRDQPYQITSLVPSFFWDRRNDPILTSRGWSTLLQLQYAFPAFTTDTEFLKVFLQQSQYFDLGHQNVVAASLRLGGIEPYKALPPSTAGNPLAGFPSRNIPIAERFFAGGDATHRAYGRDDLGIRGETLLPEASGQDFTPVGGDGLLLFNLEYRFPLFGDFGGVVFFDSGNVWADWRSIDFNHLKNGVGLGARYLSPIGPIRAGIGWKLDREKGEKGFALFVNIGNPF